MELYMYLSRNRFLPQGKYTSKVRSLLAHTSLTCPNHRA